MTAQHTRRTVLTTGAAAAGVAVGTVALAACGGGDESNTGNGQPTSGGNTESAPAGERLVALDEVPVGGATAVTTPDGQDAVVSRKAENDVACYSAICTHQGCKVNPEGAELVCPCHGSVFDAFTGQVKNGPATEPLPAFKVAVEQGEVVTA
ncbi:Rieske (2Fe-2S) protein [Prauserella cavernicola]|uniref:Cytochrome bc1 complex Rieske iron-sulfur subunit n=1 Tax=Prauserella cavernicola TaxID=2800127 RepID=A0A934V721_9PSEU|nr:Rieske (2Fe-2S) protein [Prauserella cavernicola]MBK1788127.1 Rieske (2Fe-2S) protein [Prauserella cavernicola]